MQHSLLNKPRSQTVRPTLKCLHFSKLFDQQFLFKIVIMAAILLIFSANSYAATIEIHPGTNVFKPAAESLNPGDTLIVHEGTYLETNRMSIQVQGTAAAPILIKGADGEARPLITRPTSASLQNT